MDTVEYSGLRQYLLSQKPRKDRVHREVSIIETPFIKQILLLVMGIQRSHVQCLSKISQVRFLNAFLFKFAVMYENSDFQKKRNYKVLLWLSFRDKRLLLSIQKDETLDKHSPVHVSIYNLLNSISRRECHHRWMSIERFSDGLRMSIDVFARFWHRSRRRMDFDV